MAASCCVVCIWAASYCVSIVRSMPLNYAVQYSALQRRYESLLADMQQVHGLLRRGRVGAALALLDSVLGQSDTSGRTSDASDEVLDEPMTHEDVTAALLSQVPAAPAAAFVGRSFRLDDVPGDAADDASDSSHEPCCCRCGDRENLHVFARSDVSGVWQDVESAAERTYCVDCLNACLNG